MPSRARLMASSATRWVRWRTKVKAHVLALICPSHACCSGCGSPLAPSWQAPRACKRRKAVRYASRTTPHVTCVTRHAQNAKPTSRCRTVAPWSNPLHHGAPRCDGCYHPETDGESYSPHRHKWMLSHGAPADPSDPWNSHAAPVSPRQNGQHRWQKIRTNNPLERIMREIRRRTRVVGAFPDGQSCLNLAAARLRYTPHGPPSAT